MNTRNLSFKGRAIVANILAASKLWYLASFDHVPKEIINEANSKLWNFIWRGKREVIKRGIFIQRYDDCGKKVVNIEEKINALQLKWLMKLFEKNPDKGTPKWASLSKYFIANYDNKLNSDYHYLHLNFKVNNKRTPMVYGDMLNTWKSLRLTRVNLPTSKQNLLREVLWYNDNIKNEGSVLFYEKWSKSGILRLRDIWNDDRNDWLQPWEIIAKLEEVQLDMCKRKSRQSMKHSSMLFQIPGNKSSLQTSKMKKTMIF